MKLTFNHLTIIRQLRKGKFSETYLAHDTRNRKFVIKTTASEYLQTLLQKEYHILTQVYHISQVSYGTIDNRFYLIRPYIQGQPLTAFFTGKQTVSLSQKITIISQIAGQLKALHQQQFIHNDIKPDNIIVNTDTFRAELIDFGNAVNLQEIPKEKIPFTLFYAPQECILHFNRLLHYTTDTYMLAMVLLHLIQEQSPVWQGNPTFSLHQQLNFCFHSHKTFTNAQNDFFRKALSHHVFDKPPRYYSRLKQKQLIKEAIKHRFQHISEFHTAFSNCF